MKLDSRILEGKKPLDCFDAAIAKQFIGKKGYFSDHISGFTNISNLAEDVLRNITPDDIYCEVYKTNCTSWEYFLPQEWIKEPEEKPEKKYRAFTNDEFLALFDSGKLRSIRLKDNSTKRLERLIITDIYVQGDYLYAKLNSSDTGYGPAYFFSKCEYFDGKEWRPFGIIDESQE